MLQQHGFAGAAAADDRGDLAGLEFQIDAFEHRLAGRSFCVNRLLESSTNRLSKTAALTLRKNLSGAARTWSVEVTV